MMTWRAGVQRRCGFWRMTRQHGRARREAPAVGGDERQLIGTGDLESMRVGRSVHVAPEAVTECKLHLVEAGRNTAA